MSKIKAEESEMTNVLKKKKSVLRMTSMLADVTTQEKK